MTSTKPIQIAAIAPASPREFFERIWAGIWSAARELAPFGVKVESFETEGHDPLAQQRILRQLLQSPPAAVALVPGHATSLDALIDRLTERDVPVVTFNADAPNSRRRIHIGPDPAQSGALAAELLAKLMRGSGTVASFPGSFETRHLASRYLAFREELKRLAPGIRESICHAGFAGIDRAAAAALQQSEAIEGVFVGSSRVHLVAEILEREGVRVPCVGFDATAATRPFLENGSVSALIDEFPYDQGYLAVQYAYQAIAQSGHDHEDWVRLPAGVVFAASAGTSNELGRQGWEPLLRTRGLKISAARRQLEQAHARIVTLAETDSLTGVMTRRRFEEALAACTQEKPELSLLMIGLRGFAGSMDGPGGHVNDEAVRQLARILHAHTRPEDCCARLAGGEFGILMPGTNYAAAVKVKDRILAVVKDTVIAPRTLNLALEVSFGIASMPNDAINAEDLLVCADGAMYAQHALLR